MAEQARFLRRSLNGAGQGALRVLDCLRWPTPFGTGLRLYLGRGCEAERLHVAEAADIRFTARLKAGGNTVLSGTAPEGQGSFALALDGEVLEVACTRPEPELFDDLDVLLALRHGETAEQLGDWLAHHVANHGANAALIFDRAPPDPEREAFSEAFENVTNEINGLRRIVLIDAPLPLGQEGQPALGDPARAPRAKDRSFAADPWRAPLQEGALYDLLKWRFLGRAGAVIALDPCDILRDAGDGLSAFGACRQSYSGVMSLEGEAIFAWRVRKGQVPRLADHVCRAHPPVAAPRRWGIAPRRLGADAVCLPHSVGGAQPVEGELLAYDRAMSVAFPTAEVAALVNKDTLDLDKILAARAQKAFGHRPVLPPARKPAAAAPRPAPSGRTLIVTCMKNEGPFILEWLAYHRMIGIDDFLIYTNDCDDGTDALLDALQARGLVTRRDNPFRDLGVKKPQQAALKAAQSEEVLERAGWIISMDVDEFLNIHAGEGRLADLYAAIGGANMISATWRLFGNSDIEVYEDRPVIEQFTRCAPHFIRRPHQAWGFKTLFRNNGLWESLGVHRPRGPRGAGIAWVNGSGGPMPPSMLRTGWRSGPDTYGYDLVTLNHYAVRSVESFLVKRDRGRVNHVERDQGVAYWFRMNNNDEQDLSIQRHAGALHEALAELQADPEIAALHASCVAWHRNRISELVQDKGYAALRDELCGERMRRLSRMHRHFGLNVFLRGPGSVHDSVFDPDRPANFFFNTAPPTGKAAE